MAGLYFYYATMNAGKSIMLLKDNHNYLERGMKTLVLKPSIDTREGKDVIKSRVGLEIECHVFSKEEDIYHFISKLISLEDPPACIFIDEAQFMTEQQVEQLGVFVDDLGIPVLCYGLRSDFQGKLFPGSAALFALANKLIQVKTICWCGKGAHMVLRLDCNGDVVRHGDQIAVGGNDMYVSVCRRHFTEGRSKR